MREVEKLKDNIFVKKKKRKEFVIMDIEKTCVRYHTSWTPKRKKGRKGKGNEN